MTSDARPQVVFLDTSVLVNLLHVGFLALLAQVPSLEFVLPDHVYEEVLALDQRAELDSANRSGALRTVAVADPTALDTFQALVRTPLGRGEAACIALASIGGGLVACDDRKAGRVVHERLGPGRLLTTPAVIVLLIRAGALTVTAADAARARLETAYRFRMSGFGSFQELIRKRT